MRELIFLNAIPDDIYFSWQEEIFIENVRSLGYTEEIRVLVFLPQDRLSTGFNPRWRVLEERYKHDRVNFFFYKDEVNLLHTIKWIQYIPLLRPYMLIKHFEQHPELKDKAIFYHDSDIVFTKYLDFTPFLSDNICYLSDTKSYLNSDYLLSKQKDVLPGVQTLYKEYETRILEGLTATCGISFSEVEKRKDVTGGAQYLLKNVDADFWKDVFSGCVLIREHLSYNLGGVNKKFFASENDGFQSWCADMWSVLWNLWRRGVETETPKTLDFAWATDPIEKWDQVNIYHDAGVGGENTSYLFNKNDLIYKNNITTPFQSDLSHVSKDYASSRYVDEINKVKQKYYS